MIYVFCFFFNDTATTEIYTLSLHDALPISMTSTSLLLFASSLACQKAVLVAGSAARAQPGRSEEHTSELQSRQYLVCRLLLEKKKKTTHTSLGCYASLTSSLIYLDES